jgi:uncharacterized DUF497 family protein
VSPDKTTDNQSSVIEFQGDDPKAAENLRKHRVGFAFAAKAFRDPIGIEWIDDREDNGEVRTILPGMADGSVLVVAYTERESRIRLTSARRATKNEQDRYDRENGTCRHAHPRSEQP